MSKKKTGIIVAIIAVLVALGIGAAIVIPKLVKNAGNEVPASSGNAQDDSTEESVSPTAETEPEYPEGIDWYSVKDEIVEITTAEQFYQLSELSYYFDFAGQMIVLANDIVLNEGDASGWGENPPENNFRPIRDFAGTFDGQGHTVRGLYMKADDVRLGLFSRAKDTAVVENLRVTNSYIESASSMGTATFGSWCSGTFRRLYSDATIKVDGGYAAGIVSRPDGKVSVEECWFDGSIETNGRYGGGIIDVPENNSDVAVKHCLYTGSFSTPWSMSSASVGGMAGCLFNNTTILIEDCLSVGTIEAGNKVRCGSILGGSLESSTTDIVKCFAASETFRDTVSTISFNIHGGGVAIPRKNLTGIAGYQWTDLDFENYWSVREDGSPVPTYFAAEKVPMEGVERKYHTDWYDESKSEYVIKTVEDLYGLAILSYETNFEGKTIKLDADLELNSDHANYAKWAETAPENAFITIGCYAMPFEGTFDGQDHTISGVYLSGGVYQGFFGHTGDNATVKNLKLTDSYVYSNYTIAGLLAGRGSGTFERIYASGRVDSDYNTASSIGGMIGQANGKNVISISECWFDGEMNLMGRDAQQAGGVVGLLTMASTLEMKHCLNTGKVTGNRLSGYNNLGGLIGLVNDNCTFTLEDSLAVGQVIPGLNASGSPNGGCGSAVGHLGANTLSTISKVYGAKEAHSNAIGASRGKLTGGAESVPLGDIYGTKGYQWTELDFEHYWAINPTGSPILKHFASSNPSTAGLSRMFDTSWYDPAKDSYVLYDVQDLFGFMKLSQQNDFAGKTVSLGADITVNQGNAASWTSAAPAYTWVGIGSKAKEFAGTFDGKGHSVSGIYLKETDECKGFFNVTNNQATVKNFRLLNSYFENNVNALASVAGRGNGTFQNVYSNAIVHSTGAKAQGIGGIIGQVQQQKSTNRVSNCWFDGQIIVDGNDAQQIGGIVAKQFYDSVLYVEHCLFTGSISAHRASGHNNVGGIVGFTQPTTSNGVTYAPTLNVKDCFSDGKIDAANGGYGSVVGHVGKGSVMNISDSYGTEETSAKAIGATGGNYYGVTNGSASSVKRNEVLGTGAYEWMDLDFASTWGCIADGTPRLRAFTDASKILSTEGITKVDTSWYDPAKDVFQISTKEQLLSLIKLSTSLDKQNKKINFAGKTIELAADIVLNENSGQFANWGQNPPETVWTTIFDDTNPFAGTFDGKGHSITGLYVKSEGEGSGFFGQISKTAAVKNVSFVNAYVESSNGTRMGVIAGRGAGTIDTVYTNGIVKTDAAAANFVGGFVGQVCYGDLTVKNSEFEGSVIETGASAQGAGGFIGGMNNGVNVTMENCLFDGSVENRKTASGYSNTAGLVGMVMNNGTNSLTVKDSVSAGTVLGGGTGAVGIVIGQNGANQTVTLENVYAATGSAVRKYENAESNPGAIGGGTGTLNGAAKVLAKEKLTDVRAYHNTVLDFDTVWAAKKEALLKLKAFPGSGETIDVSGMERVNEDWFDPTQTEYVITTKDELLRYAALTNENSIDFAGKTLKLGADIVLNEDHESYESWGTAAPATAWTPWGNDSAPFAGTFDGQGHTIYGIYLKTEKDFSGFFGMLKANAAVVTDVRLKNGYIESSYKDRVGSVAGRAAGEITKVYSNLFLHTTNKDSSWVGGLVGQGVYGPLTIRNSQFDGHIVQEGTNSQAVGGLVGGINGTITLTMEHCLFTGKVESKRTATGANRAGGLLGFIMNNGTNTLVVKDSLSGGTVLGASAAVGSIVGQINANQTATFENVYGVKGSAMIGSSEAPLYGEQSGTVNGEAEEKTLEEMTGAEPMAETALLFGTYWVAVQDKLPELKVFSNEEGLQPPAPKYTVTFVDDDGTTVLKEATKYEAGTTAADIVKPDDPTKAADSQYTYTFAGWTPEITDVTADAVYKATYRKNIISDTSWYNDSATEFVLMTINEFVGFSELSKTKDFAGKTVKLGADMVLNPDHANFESWGETAPEFSWTSIGPEAYNGASVFKGIFDGQGHTIAGLYQKETTPLHGLFSQTNGVATVKNFKLIDSYFETSAQQRIGSVAGVGLGTFESIYSNAIVKNTHASGQFIGGLVGQGWLVTFTDCWFDGKAMATGANGQMIGGILGASTAAYKVEMTDCLFTGEISTIRTGAGSNMGGMIGALYNAAIPVKLTDCVSAGTVKATGETPSLVGSVAGQIASGKNITFAATNVYALDGSSTLNKTVGVGAITSGEITVLSEEQLFGEAAKTNTALNFTEKWVVREGKCPVLQLFAAEGGLLPPTPKFTVKFVDDDGSTVISEKEYEEGTAAAEVEVPADPVKAADSTYTYTFKEWTPAVSDVTADAVYQAVYDKEYVVDTSWYNDTDTVFTLTTINELLGFSEISKAKDFAGKTVKLGANMVLNEDHENYESWGETAPKYSWTPIGPTAYNGTGVFKGTFDGQGHSVSGLYLKSTKPLVGLFSQTNGVATVKDFKLLDSYFETSGSNRAGSIAGVGLGTFDTIYTNAIVKNTNASGQYTGGIVGQGWSVTFNKCWFDGKAMATGANGQMVGGILGGATAAYAVKMSDCLFTGEVSTVRTGAGSNLGGLIGIVFNAAVPVTIENTVSAGSVNAKGAVPSLAGSLAGQIASGKGITFTVTNVYVLNGSCSLDKIIGVGAVTSGTVSELTEAQLFGDAAETNTALDFTSKWVTRNAASPALKAFSE